MDNVPITLLLLFVNDRPKLLQCLFWIVLLLGYRWFSSRHSADLVWVPTLGSIIHVLDISTLRLISRIASRVIEAIVLQCCLVSTSRQVLGILAVLTSSLPCM